MKNTAKEIIDFIIESAPQNVINDLVEQAQDMLDCGKSVDSTLNSMSEIACNL